MLNLLVVVGFLALFTLIASRSVKARRNYTTLREEYDRLLLFSDDQHARIDQLLKEQKKLIRAEKRKQLMPGAEAGKALLSDPKFAMEAHAFITKIMAMDKFQVANGVVYYTHPGEKSRLVRKEAGGSIVWHGLPPTSKGDKWIELHTLADIAPYIEPPAGSHGNP